MRVCHMCILGLLCAANGGNKYSTCRRVRAMLRVIEYFAKSLKITQGHSNWYHWKAWVQFHIRLP